MEINPTFSLYLRLDMFNLYTLQVGLSDLRVSKIKNEIEQKEHTSTVSSSFADTMTADEADNLLSAR